MRGRRHGREEHGGRRFRHNDRDRPTGEKSAAPSESRVLDYLNERFGLEPSLFSDSTFYLGVKDRLYLGPSSDIADMGGLRIATIGLMVARADAVIKPTTNLLQAFGRSAKRNYIQLEKEKAITYAMGLDISIAKEDAGSVTEGYVLLKYLEFPLGCGHLKNGVVKNMLPKAKRLKLKYI